MKLNVTLNGRQLQRSRSNRWLMGVCGGVAENYGWDVNLVRAVTAVLAIAIPGASLFPVALAYVFLGLTLPESDV